jgi:hypothetical protein
MGALLRPQPRNIRAVERNLAAEIMGDPDHAIDQRRLAHTVAAKERDRLALAQRQRDVGEDDGFAIAGA